MDLEDIVFLFKTLLTIGLIVFIILYIVNDISEKSCKFTSKELGFEYKYSFMTGCIVKTPKEKIPIEQYIIVETEK